MVAIPCGDQVSSQAADDNFATVTRANDVIAALIVDAGFYLQHQVIQHRSPRRAMDFTVIANDHVITNRGTCQQLSGHRMQSRARDQYAISPHAANHQITADRIRPGICPDGNNVVTASTGHGIGCHKVSQTAESIEGQCGVITRDNAEL